VEEFVVECMVEIVVDSFVEQIDEIGVVVDIVEIVVDNFVVEPDFEFVGSVV
jgi:hypothetical protein